MMQLSLIEASTTSTTSSAPGRHRAAVGRAYSVTKKQVIAAERRASRTSNGAPMTPTERRMRIEIALLHESLAHFLSCDHDRDDGRCPRCEAHLAALSRCDVTPLLLEEHEAIVDARRLATRLSYVAALERSVVGLLRSIAAARSRVVGPTVWSGARAVADTIKGGAMR